MNYNNMDKMLGTVSGKLGVDKAALKNAVESGSAEKLMNALGPEQSAQLNELLSDKEATRKLMQSEQVQKLIKKLSEGK